MQDSQLINSFIDNIQLDKDRPFSIQVRNINNTAYTAKDIEVKSGQFIEKKYKLKAYFDDKNIPQDIGQQIINIFIFGNMLFIGLGNASANIYTTADPYRIFSGWKSHISRAEFKLREALYILDYKPEKDALALDLGAAPGGWSYTLAESGMRVIAIDPAKINEEVSKHKNVIHIQKKAEDYFISEKIGLIVNDMNMDSNKSAKIMLSLSNKLKSRGYVIMTIKLTHGPYADRINEVKRILSNDFNFIDVRCLFHNRQEVTAFLRKK
jgi:23S rRNA (cytidine2498-2'-O)-methyltransferase